MQARATDNSRSNIAGIEKEFISGDLSKAGQHSEETYKQFELSRPDWAATFRLELAKVLTYQGKNRDVLDLLEQPLPALAPPLNPK